MKNLINCLKNLLLLQIITGIVFLCLQLVSYSTAFCQKNVLKVGIAKADITPKESLYFDGYSLRTQSSEGVYGKLYVRAIVFDDNERKIAFVEGDIVEYGDYAPIRQSISDATGIPFKNIMLGNVHNHASPRYGEINSTSEWYRQFTGKHITAVKKAIENLEPVKIGGGIGKSDLAMNRRQTLEGGASYKTFDENWSSQAYGKHKTDNPVLIQEIAGVNRLGVNPEGPIDDEVGIIRIDDMSGKPKAVFINYAAHGVSLGGRNLTISPEWNGHMLEYVEMKIPGITGIFVQGAAGDVNPRRYGFAGYDNFTDDVKKTQETGFEIGREVVRVFNSIVTKEPDNARIELTHKDILLPRRYRELYEDFRNTTIKTPTTIITMDEFAWVTFPGELFNQIGKRIKSATHAKYSFLVGYCNGSVGYLPTQKAYSEGGYEPSQSHFAPVSEHILMKEINKLLLGMFNL